MIEAFARRFFSDGAKGVDRQPLLQSSATLAGLTLLLIVELFLSETLERHFPGAWMALAVVLALALSRAQYGTPARPAVRLWQLLGALSAFYALFHYPLMPPMHSASAQRTLVVMLILWIGALACGIGCFKVPSLSLVPPVFLVWSAKAAKQVTGLHHGETLDVAPLPEVSLCIGLGLATLLVFNHWRRTRLARGEELPAIDEAGEFSNIILIFSISIHLANYFWSSISKLTLHGPFLSWIWLNNPLNIYLAAFDDQHITFAGSALASRSVAYFLDRTHLLSNLFVFAAQTAAIVAFIMPKRAFILLLACFDIMHIGIAIAAGANFWPWVLLNVVITIAVARPDYRQPTPLRGLMAAAFICIAPAVANVALLGWYDSGANNDAYFLAVDRSGQRYFVSPNFFTFYSFPLAHMSYGMPEPATAFATGDPNGGTRDYRIARAGMTCDVAKLIVSNAQKPVPEPSFRDFVINYHNMAKSIENRIGIFPYNVYPHHFYVRPSLARGFDQLDKNDVVAYIYRRESVCLSLVDGLPHRRVISTGEYRIDLPHE